MRDSARPFSRLQSTQNPSPSGEGRSMACTLHFGIVIGTAVFRHETTKSRNHEKDVRAFVFVLSSFRVFRGCLSVLNQRVSPRCRVSEVRCCTEGGTRVTRNWSYQDV